MHSSRGPPPHGATPSPTDRSNAHTAAPTSFHTSESMPPSPHFFTMNPLTDQRLTGPVMPYHPMDHHPLSSTPTYQDTWQYPASWDAPVLDPGAPSENPPSTPLHTLGGMVSAASHEGSTFAPPLPSARAVQDYFSSTQTCPYPASPSSGSPVNTRESSLRFGANVSTGSAPAVSPHMSQGTSIQPFTSPDIWPPHGPGAGVSPNPIKPTVGLVTSLNENQKGKSVLRRSPTESSRGSSRYDPVGSRHSRGTPRSAAASEPLTDEGEEERDSDGSARDVRDKKRRYAKTFRDIEKQLFEKLRHRLFPQDPHAKRSECLERAIESIDDLLLLRESETRRQQEIEALKQKLTDAERRVEHLYRELNGRSLTIGN